MGLSLGGGGGLIRGGLIGEEIRYGPFRTTGEGDVFHPGPSIVYGASNSKTTQNFFLKLE